MKILNYFQMEDINGGSSLGCVIAGLGVAAAIFGQWEIVAAYGEGFVAASVDCLMN
jgi:hypothetical protein